MEAKRLAESLQDAEIVVLKALKKNVTSSTDDLVAKTQLNKDAINRATLWLQNKQLISVKEQSHFLVVLDNLGKKYAVQGLPERKFLHALDKKTMATEDIAQAASLDKQETLFSLGFWKKKGIIEFMDGKVTITRENTGYLTKKTLEEEFVHKLHIEGEIPFEKLANEDKGAFEELKKRGLVLKQEKKLREFSATELGLKVADSITSESRVGQLTPDLIRTGAWKGSSFRRFDIAAPVPKLWPGKKQAYKRFLDEVKEELVAMGFEEMNGPLVEQSFWNSDALYMPQDHPAKGIHDIYYVKEPKYGKIVNANLLKAVKAAHENGGKSGSTGWQYNYNEQEAARLLLRTQGTALSARMLANPDIKIPGAYFAVARCFRPDVIDATHLPEFNHCEGIILGDKLNFKDLLSLLTEFAKKFTGTDKVRWRPHYFPFTEPSLEGDVWHPTLKRWVETFAAGMFRPEITSAFGIKVPVLAWGPGIDRMFMIRENISDIRQLFSQDIRWLREAKI
jgi:phenylalanyl-tRNA synthetase alpha chain